MSAPGKTLDDWQPRPAERRLATEMASGVPVVIGQGVPPDPPPPERVIRASFLRALILGQIDGCPVHEKGVRAAGAFIEGDGPEGAETRGLDLEGCELRQDLGLFYCKMPDKLLMRGASLRNLYLNNSHLGAGLDADRLKARDGVFLRGIEAQGAVRLLGAKLGGSLDCEGARPTAVREGHALAADGLEARGSVFLRGIVAQGEVRLLGAKLGGSLDCIGAHLSAVKEGDALSADRLEARGSVFLHGVIAKGTVRLLGAKLGGDLVCDGAQMTAKDRALSLDGARLNGVLFLHKGSRIDGTFDLNGAEIGYLADDPACWPGPNHLSLNRCRYGAFVGVAPVDAPSRIRWLSLQDESRWGQEFWPQPWEQCAKVLREMGHGADARAILIEKERRQRAARRARLRRDDLYTLVFLQALSDRVMGATTLYGRMPLLAVAWLAGFWLLGTFVFADAAGQGAIKPNSPFVLRAPEWVECRPGGARAGDHPHQLACFLAQPEAASYPRFHAGMYSLDTLLPVVALEMQGFWIPDDTAPRGAWARGWLWLHIAAGWGLSLLAVAGFSGLIRIDSTT